MQTAKENLEQRIEETAQRLCAYVKTDDVGSISYYLSDLTKEVLELLTQVSNTDRKREVEHSPATRYNFQQTT